MHDSKWIHGEIRRKPEAEFQPTPVRRRRLLLRFVEFCCWSAGGLAILFVALSAWDSYSFQAKQAERLEQLKYAHSGSAPIQTSPVFSQGTVVGKISIPRIGLSAMVAEGVDAATLRHAVGHVPGTATPEKGGTVVLAGHRDTFFRPLSKIRENDSIVMDMPNGKRLYKVVRTFVVEPTDVSLMQSSPASDLTLITCYPFHYIGPAPKRFVVQAVRADPSSQIASQNVTRPLYSLPTESR